MLVTLSCLMGQKKQMMNRPIVFGMQYMEALNYIVEAPAQVTARARRGNRYILSQDLKVSSPLDS